MTKHTKRFLKKTIKVKERQCPDYNVMNQKPLVGESDPEKWGAQLETRLM